MPLTNPASELESAHSRCNAGSSVVYAAKPVMLKISAPHIRKVSRTGVSRRSAELMRKSLLKSSSKLIGVHRRLDSSGLFQQLRERLRHPAVALGVGMDGIGLKLELVHDVGHDLALIGDVELLRQLAVERRRPRDEG